MSARGSRKQRSVRKDRKTVQCDARYYLQTANSDTFLGERTVSCSEFTPDEIGNHQCHSLLTSLIRHYATLLTTTKPDPGSTVHVGIHPGCHPHHMIFNFWMSTSEPKCRMYPMDNLIASDGSIVYRWVASLGSVILHPKQHVPMWLNALWTHTTVFPENSRLVLEITHIDHSTAPLMSAWFEPCKTSPTDDVYLIVCRCPYDATKSVTGHIRFRKTHWRQKKTDRIDYRF